MIQLEKPYFAPSFKLTPLICGIGAGVAFKLFMNSRKKNAKQFRPREEYGSAKWGTDKDFEPYTDPVKWNNIPLTATEWLRMTRPEHPKYDRNKNILIVGGSGAGKTRGFVKPSLMQMQCSYVVTDPKGTVLEEVGTMLARGAWELDDKGNKVPKVGKNGQVLKTKSGKVIYKRTPYKIKVFNTINFAKSMHYNPFAYIHTEQDVLKFVNTLIANTKGEGAQSGEDFWVKAERLLFTAYGSHIHILDWALHLDEATPHIHERHALYRYICMGTPLDVDEQREFAGLINGIKDADETDINRLTELSVKWVTLNLNPMAVGELDYKR